MIDPLRLLDVMRVVSAAMWSLLVAKSLPSFVRTSRRNDVRRYYDMLRMAFGSVGAHAIVFNAQWLLFRDTLRGMAPDQLAVKSALYGFSTAVAFGLLLTLRVYERDCRDC